MGIFAFKLPDIGEGVVEGEVVEWMVKVGDVVAEDDPILSVMTDKATVEIPSPVDGKVISQSSGAGEIIAVGSVCIEFEVDGEGNASATSEGAGETDSDSANENPEPTSETEDDNDDADEVDEPEVPTEDEPDSAATASTPTKPKSTGSGSSSGKVLASPAVRSAAQQADVDLATVSGTGPAGRISKADLEAHIESAASGGSSSLATGCLPNRAGSRPHGPPATSPTSFRTFRSKTSGCPFLISRIF